ncbi:Hypothetical protein MVR_LOCUS59 [uncultured virus]|nr:Hypothetical protein MVR_LOCUS59 [uncultured virus]
MSVALFLEIRNEYTEHLVDVLTPYIYEGLTSIYKHANETADQLNQQDKVLMIFQKLLQTISDWNQARIEQETTRIKQLSNTFDYLDNLVKAVAKSNIILLTYSNTVSNVIAQNFYNTLTTSTLIHRCYTECGKYAHNFPYFFYHGFTELEYKRNQISVTKEIREGIIRATRKILPLSIILKEFLINSANIIYEPPKVELMGLGVTAEGCEIPEPMFGQMPPSSIFGIPPPPAPTVPGSGSGPQAQANAVIEQKVRNMVLDEGARSEQDQIKNIMMIDQILSSSGPRFREETRFGGSSEARRREQSSADDHNSQGHSNHQGRPMLVPADSGVKRPSPQNHNNHGHTQLAHTQLSHVGPHLVENEDYHGYGGVSDPGHKRDLFGGRLRESDRKIININFDDEPSEPMHGAELSISETSLPGTKLPQMPAYHNSRPRQMYPNGGAMTSDMDPSKVEIIEDYGRQYGSGSRRMPSRFRREEAKR